MVSFGAPDVFGEIDVTFSSGSICGNRGLWVLVHTIAAAPPHPALPAPAVYRDADADFASRLVFLP